MTKTIPLEARTEEHHGQKVQKLYAKLTDLHLDPNNSNTHPDKNLEAIKGSLAEFGQDQPLVVQVESGLIIKGNGRFLAMKDLSWVDAWVYPVDDDKLRAVARSIADNRSSELAVRDEEVLARLLQEVEAANPGLFASTGYSEDELARLLAQLDTDAKEVDMPDKVASRVKLGDKWRLGDHVLVCGDATDADTWKRLLGDGKADLVVTDPPYGVHYANKNAWLNANDQGARKETHIKDDDLKPEELAALWQTVLSCAIHSCKAGASYYITAPQGGDLLHRCMAAINRAGWQLKQTIIWAKNGHVLGRSDYNYQHEPILYGWGKGKHSFYGPKNETSLWHIDRPSASKLHPTMKPVALFARCIKNSSKEGDHVVDPFAGSGTTILAAEQLGRHARCIELEPAYCDVILHRWEDLTGHKAEKVKA